MRSWITVVVMAAALLSVGPLDAQTPSLAQQRADTALRVLTSAIAHYNAGTTVIDDVGTWAARWYQARCDTGLTGAPLIAQRKTGSTRCARSNRP